MPTIILPPGGGDVHLRVRPLPDGSTAIDIDYGGSADRQLIRIADAARSLLEPDLPPDIAKYELDAAKKRIRRATERGEIQKVGTQIVRSDFETWRASR